MKKNKVRQLSERLGIEPETDDFWEESIHSFPPPLLIGSGTISLSAQMGTLWPE